MVLVSVKNQARLVHEAVKVKVDKKGNVKAGKGKGRGKGKGGGRIHDTGMYKGKGDDDGNGDGDAYENAMKSLVPNLSALGVEAGFPLSKATCMYEQSTTMSTSSSTEPTTTSSSKMPKIALAGIAKSWDHLVK